MRRIRLLFLVVLLCFPVWGMTQLYTFKKYNHRDGLVTEFTLSSVQDRDGYLWIGTDGGGLMRFDGKRFMEVEPMKKHQPLHVSDVLQSQDGSMYFATLYDGLYQLKNNKYQFIYKPQGIDGDIRRISLVDTSLILFTDRCIRLLSKNGKITKSYLFNKSTNVDYHQILKTPYYTIAFTSIGNFVITNKGIFHLNYWLKQNKVSIQADFGTFSKNSLQLIDTKNAKILTIKYSGYGKNIKSFYTKLEGSTLEGIAISKAISSPEACYIVLKNNRILKFTNKRIISIANNYLGELGIVNGLTIDKNKDLWINSSYGIIKVSKEPFTKIELSPIYNDPGILVIHKTADNQVILGNNRNELYIGKLYSNDQFIKHNLHLYQVVECPLGILLATDKGILQLVGNTIQPINLPNQQNQPISLMHWDGSSLWYAIRGESLQQYNPKDQSVKSYKNINSQFPRYFYTAQNNFNYSEIYFGSNNGVWKFNKNSGKFSHLTAFQTLGTYCGNSTKDKFGTLWFTFDKGIAGITRGNEPVILDDPEKFPSTLFYTLSSDNYGNLLIGTNKGINVLRVDRNGNLIKQRNYSNKEGFGGYETNMRAVYQSGNFSIVGSIEGLYLIDSDILESYPLPYKPFIIEGRENRAGEIINSADKRYFTFYSVMGKSSGILYSYRIKGFKDLWSNFSTENEIAIPSLTNGIYSLEVRASYDGINFSEISTQVFQVNEPLWKSKWFIVILVVLLGIINIGYLQWSKTFHFTTFLETNDTSVDVRLIPKLMAFAAFMNLAVIGLVKMVEPDLFDPFVYAIVSTAILASLYFASKFYEKQAGKSYLLNYFVLFAYATLIIADFYLILVTNLHPFPLYSLVTTTGILPFLLKQIRYVVIICLTQLFIAAGLVIWMEDTVYNEVLFIAAVTISGGVAVLLAFLRNDSLEKLIFVNALVNKGNVMAISFDQMGNITYCSSNISDYFSVDSTSILGKPLSILNPVVSSSEMRQIKLYEEFKDGKIFLVPMVNKKNEIVYIEWSCKYFNNSVRVIMGQDITDKLTMTTNYQSLVENAQDMIYNTDINGNFIYANERCIQLFGFKNDSVKGKNSLFLVAPEYRERVEQFYREQFTNRIHHTYLEFPIKSRDGKQFWVGQNVSMIYEPGSRKRISGFIALARDITEKRANEFLIDQQNKDITSSINSAKRIQFNLLPSPKQLANYFDESFVIFKPKDIVSGDFFWLEEIDGKLIIALADSTGHGVPGAFMTIVGINLLNQIVRERKVLEPQEILAQLNAELAKTLPKNESGSYTDGIDMLIAVLEKDQLIYATSGVGLIHVSNGNLFYSRSTKLPEENGETYTQQQLTIAPQDQFYFLTNGYQKQLGSIHNKKFSYQRIQELLEKIHPESMALQKKYFENAWVNWSEGHEQTDDITIIGLKGYRAKN
ncbi:MAG: PAS domain S-box protein [Fluviicola sp.]|nr:PAS domain S-box protein [Fluviicola sp.]